MTRVDLNSDLGEGYGVWRLGDDEALLDVVTSANVACGFHAGDPSTIRRTVDSAVARDVAIGAQVSYPDVVGFGRRPMEVAPEDLTADVLYQLGALDAFCRAAGTAVRYVKPHGALYHRVADDGEQAAALVAAVRGFDPSLPLLGLAGSALDAASRAAGMRLVAEAFADRALTPDARLVPRSQPGAVLHDLNAIVRRAVRMVMDRQVETVDGTVLDLEIGSLCVHGDTPNAVQIARALRRALTDAGVQVERFA